MGLSEDEYLTIVEHIQQAMCIEPFRPDAADVVALIGDWQVLHREIERLRAAVTDLGVAHIAAWSKACPRCGYDRTQEP